MKKKIKKQPTQKQFFDWVEKRMVYYRHLLNINNWQVHIEKKLKKDDDGTSMETHFTDEGYTKVTLAIYECSFERFKKKDWQDLNRSILHEMLHIVMRDFELIAWDRFTTKNQLRENRERLVENLTVIIDRMDNKI